MRSLLLLIVLSLAFPFSILAAQRSTPKPREVVTSLGSWTDAARGGREVPYRIYLPKESDAPCPIVIVSHGLGGNRNTYAYLGRHFASHGYATVHLQHRGSDTEVLREAMVRGETPVAALKKSVGDLRNAIERPRDVSFAIDELEKANIDIGELQGRLDLTKIAMAGHSFGAYTAMAIAGQSGGGVSFRDKRVSAAIGMSAPAPKGAGTYAKIDIPVLLMTGTLDDSPLLGGKAEERIAAFDQLAIADRYLVVFTGGDHMMFSGAAEALGAFRLPGTAGDRAMDAAFQEKIAGLSLAFLDGYLCGDAAAVAWLKEDAGAKENLGALGTLKAVSGK